MNRKVRLNTECIAILQKCFDEDIHERDYNNFYDVIDEDDGSHSIHAYYVRINGTTYGVTKYDIAEYKNF